jgi:5-methylcytosine-specific restriction endonuclease McrA
MGGGQDPQQVQPGCKDVNCVTVNATAPKSFWGRIGGWFGAIGAVISRSLGGWGGPRAGKPFTRTGRLEVINQNLQQYGQATCVNCERPLAPSTQSTAGVTPADNEMRVDHVWPQSKLGNGDPETNGQLLCSTCNLEKSDSLPMLEDAGRPVTDYSEPGLGADFQLGLGGSCGPFGGESCD